MPATQDSIGRYYLSTMWDRVRRLMDADQASVDNNTGVETNNTIQDQSMSNIDITNQINSSLTGLWVEMITEKEKLFTVTQYISTGIGIGPYTFPPNMFQMRWLKWKSPAITLNNARPEDWWPMAEVSDPNDTESIQAYRAPTWRWDGDGFVLNTYQTEINSNGIQINFVNMPSELVNPTDVITVPSRFARVTQQAVIYDTAYILGVTKKLQVPDEIGKLRDEWHTRLMTAITNAFNAESTQFVAPSRMARTSYSGRLFKYSNWGTPGGW